MNVYLTVFAASLGTFAVTNVDDICLLTLFFARRVPGRRIVAGQYIGFSAIILLSLIGVLAALAIPHGWSRVLGVLPPRLNPSFDYRLSVKSEKNEYGQQVTREVYET